MPRFPVYEKIKTIGLRKSLLLGYNLLLNKIDKKQRRVSLFSKPITLQLEPTTKCNLACAFCESPVWDRKGGDMSFSEFKHIINQFPYVTSLLLQGIGEPLACKDFFKMVKYCKEKKIMVGITTNGTLLTKDVAKKMVEYGLDWVIVSMDGSKKETFEKIRIGANFNKVIDNVRNLVKIRGQSRKPMIIFLFTITKLNVNELPDVVRLAKELGIDAVEVQDTHYWGDENLKYKVDDLKIREDLELTKEILNKARREAEKLGIKFTILGTGGRSTYYTKEDKSIYADQRLCKQMFRSCFITFDGYVTPCACWPDPRKFNLGNILEKDFGQIWNSKKYQQLRRERLNGQLPKYCEMCTVPRL